MTKSDAEMVKVHATGTFYEGGKRVRAGDEPFEVPRHRAEALKRSRLVRFDNDDENVNARPRGFQFLQEEGKPNKEPEPDTSLGPVSPAPGQGVPDEPKQDFSMLMAEGAQVNPEPEPDTTFGPVSPPPGQGMPERDKQDPNDVAERAAMKVRENRAPDDPGASEEDNYAVPLAAVMVDEGGGQGVRAVTTESARQRAGSERAASEPATRSEPAARSGTTENGRPRQGGQGRPQGKSWKR